MMPLAVDRNRLRRRLREAVRAARPPIESLDVILRQRRATGPDDNVAAVGDARALIGRALAARP
jgi:ribonuclease P protein component